MLDIRPLGREEIVERLPDLARLRIKVFADWPYLYDGDEAYERRYLQTYIDSPASIVVGAFDGDTLVGAATGTPMEDHAEEFAQGFAGRGMPAEDIFYCAESLLLPDWRGQGVGHCYFDLREEHARRLGRRWSAFCAVIRPSDHPARPAGYRSLDPFWSARGYEPLPGAVVRFRWRDHGEVRETEKPLQVWIRDLWKTGS
jgi:GNAT superfamily N-acetyltransferase